MNEQLLAAGMGLNWKKFNRTVFEFLARRINRKVTQDAIAHPALIVQRLILGKDQWQRYTGMQVVSTDEAVRDFLMNQRRPFNWISGKTLHSYWNEGKAKDTRINVLLTYLDVSYMDWDDWKNPVTPVSGASKGKKTNRRNANQELIRKYFIGSYFLYYQKSDSSRCLVKAPFIIGIDALDQVFSETITEGHPYKSTVIELRDGILYIHFENQVFDDKENHIFNVGNETNPEVLFGVSNTISVKKKLAIGIRNLLVKQKQPFGATTFHEKEIPFDGDAKLSKEESTVLKYFLKQPINIINSQHCCSFSTLVEKVQ